jgi:hypothetical protein
VGCDIHLYVEVRDGGRWRHVPVADNYRDAAGDLDYEQYANDPLYVGRNYALFAILAGVRNGRGVVDGADTGNRYVPIADPRGLPEDLTPEVRAEANDWRGDAHGHSWHSLAHLLEYDWWQRATRRGVVGPKEYAALQATGRPSGWSAGVSGRGVRIVSNAEMEQFLAAGETDPADRTRSTYTQLEWDEQYTVSAGNVLAETIPALLNLIVPEGSRYDPNLFLKAFQAGDRTMIYGLRDWLMDRGLPSPDDVRVVFFFDN